MKNRIFQETFGFEKTKNFQRERTFHPLHTNAVMQLCRPMQTLNAGLPQKKTGVFCASHKPEDVQSLVFYKRLCTISHTLFFKSMVSKLLTW